MSRGTCSLRKRWTTSGSRVFFACVFLLVFLAFSALLGLASSSSLSPAALCFRQAIYTVTTSSSLLSLPLLTTRHLEHLAFFSFFSFLSALAFFVDTVSRENLVGFVSGLFRVS